jgi:anti-anti-sigma factor
MNTEVRHENGIVVVVVTGSVDALTAAELSGVITAPVADGNVHLVVDLTGVEFMSSAGLRTLLVATKEARSSGGDLRIASNNPGIDKLLKMSGFSSIAKVFTNAADAVSSFVAQA